MFPLSRVWAWWLIALQILNAVLAFLAYFQVIPGDFGWLVTWRANAAVWHGSIGVFLGSVQAFAKALPDTDGDGIPDLFDDTPNGPTDGAG